MFHPPRHRYTVPFDGSFKVSEAPTAPDEVPDKKRSRKRLQAHIDQIKDLQRILYAQDTRSLLLVFQAMDAAGKDSTIRAVMSGVNPAGFQVYSFKQPSSEELDHDFLWRTARSLPERGRIGIFNRSYYEEVLVVRVHPELLKYQRMPMPEDPAHLWEQRYESILEHERHLARNGTIVLKFWLNVSREEQRQRFLARIDQPEKNWKFSPSDVRERGYWDDYMSAYQDALNATSRPWAPWFSIPADNKPYMRQTVAEIVADTLKALDLSYPTLDDAAQERLGQMRDALLGEEG